MPLGDGWGFGDGGVEVNLLYLLQYKGFEHTAFLLSYKFLSTLYIGKG